MSIVCCYCGKPMGTKDGQGIEGVSHSICPLYLARELAKIQGKEEQK